MESCRQTTKVLLSAVLQHKYPLTTARGRATAGSAYNDPLCGDRFGACSSRTPVTVWAAPEGGIALTGVRCTVLASCLDVLTDYSHDEYIGHSMMLECACVMATVPTMDTS